MENSVKAELRDGQRLPLIKKIPDLQFHQVAMTFFIG